VKNRSSQKIMEEGGIRTQLLDTRAHEVWMNDTWSSQSTSSSTWPAAEGRLGLPVALCL
jgi:hypothetical protein